MWGFHDHALSMRKALNETLVTLKGNNSLYRRWRWAQSIQHKKVRREKHIFSSIITKNFYFSINLFILKTNGMKNGKVY
jgi:hypothetical protein